ncbi:peptidase domain-containing ABC transporter [Arenimonas sp.]|uniref:peptidase domain-containing ABC transporter n=1 Tax=Arenimonas sp. TaxID=1872635 RepID=UPI002E360271|nr:peptidase domain-containing ABC transporter [Arenimonas sp.]HEX4853507.1 peptidase domain-containing ABC transporter [Arenimonas sp.]
MRPVRQSQAAECGLACLAMIAAHHGHGTDLRALRQRFPLSLKGATLARLVEIAQALGFQARALRLELDELGKLGLPCILHWDLDHFVVLEKAGRRRVRVCDPAFGARVLALEEVSRHFTGVALELVPGAGFETRPRPASVPLSALAGPVQGLWPALAQLLLLSVALQVFVLLAPFFMQWVVDQALVAGDRDLLAVLALGFGLALLLQVAIGLVRGWAVASLSSRVGLQWTGNVFAHALRLPLEYFETRHLGDVVSRMGSVQAIQRTLTAGFIETLVDGLMAAATLAMMLVYSPELALVTLGAVLLYLALRALSYGPLRNATEKQLVAAARQHSHLLESLRGMQSLKVAGQEARCQARQTDLRVDTVNQELRLARLGLGFSTASQAIFGIERIAVVWLGARLAMDSVFSAGMLIAYLAYKDQFAMRVSGLVDQWIAFRMLRLHGERLADIVLAAPEPGLADAFEAAPPAEARLDVRGLGFRYAEGEPWVLRDCHFTIAPGESVAIIGASGSGKTTLVKLLLGLLAPTEGGIRVGGLGLGRLGMRNYRAMVGAVMQDDQLFAGSVAENIAFGDDAIDAARVEAAARLAAVHDEIVAMPMGYHSLIGDLGSTLSGGQKQRVLLARALYRKPRILFLDEATSHLDVDRERRVNAAIRGLKLTRVIIAHRPETIASADRVLVMDGGRIVREFRPRRPAPGAAKPTPPAPAAVAEA